MDRTCTRRASAWRVVPQYSWRIERIQKWCAGAYARIASTDVESGTYSVPLRIPPLSLSLSMRHPFSHCRHTGDTPFSIQPTCSVATAGASMRISTGSCGPQLLPASTLRGSRSSRATHALPISRTQTPPKRPSRAWCARVSANSLWRLSGFRGSAMARFASG